jgi:hypothetical protein
VWHSNLTAGFVATPATSTVADTVADKSDRKYRSANELWLAIQCSPRISETLLPIDVSDLDSIRGSEEFQFARVFMLTFLGVWMWKRMEGWCKLDGNPDLQFTDAFVSSLLLEF